MSDPTVVIKVLKIGGVDVSANGDEFTLAKDGVPIQTYILPLNVERKMLFRFEYRFKIPIHWFFHPEMAEPRGDSELVQ